MTLEADPHARDDVAAPSRAQYSAGSTDWRARWRRSAAGRRLAQWKQWCSAPRALLHRRRTAEEWLARTPESVRMNADGWARFEAGTLPGAEDAIELARRVRAERAPLLERIRAGRSGGRRITLDLFGDDLLARHPELVDQVLADAWLRPVVEYLGTIPFLARVTLAHSGHLPELEAPAFHQRFHLDNDDTRHVKLYVHTHEVTEEHGPVCFLPAAATERVLAALAREGFSRAADTTYDDVDVFRHASPDELVTITGPAGAGVYADLSRCLHYGSRVRAGRERAVLVVEFLRFHRLHENASNQLDPPRADHDLVRRHALTPPVRRPRGYFLDDVSKELPPR
ncbi:MAG: hypothetical protein HZA53_18055 [Planctomycetes bacterium]|nr:hypothetical protein [Planctomycetota bacterium]